MAYMWKLIIGVILVMVCIQAETFQDLLRPLARHITGVVIDVGGEPVSHARIDHTNDRRQEHQTDSQGRFEVIQGHPSL